MVLKVSKVLRGNKVLLVPKVHKERLAPKEFKANKALLVPKVPKALQVSKVPKVPKVFLENKALLGLKVPTASSVLLVRLALLERVWNSNGTEQNWE